MPSLPRDLRKKLETVTMNARDAAEEAARLALENLGVQEKEARGHMTPEQRLLRNKLRALGRARGDIRDERTARQSLAKLTEHTAYEHWHRMLFARFLAENHLLRTHPGGVPVSLADCEELAESEGARDGFELACRYAVPLLPGIFRADDPALSVRLAPEGQAALRNLLDQLPAGVFTADDSLGWTYQFWQARRKDQVNESGKKIGADELPSVTQLFTEDYMVDFLLDNTLGAWHAGKVLAASPRLAESAASEDELRAACALPGCPWTYLRFVRTSPSGPWRPAAGTFDGWPKTAAQIRALDPCMGSGHFVVAMFIRLVALRVAEEGLTTAQAVVAVLRDNLFGLEIDPRCTQIAAFNLALTAWKLGDFQPLPPLHLACSGLAPRAKLEDWVKLAGGNENLKYGMRQLHKTFEQAPTLGSLINPRTITGAGHIFQFKDLAPLMGLAMRDEGGDYNEHEMAVVAQGIATAAEILAGHFTLVATNVPFLSIRRQSPELRTFLQQHHPDGKACLSASFVERCVSLCQLEGTSCFVTPQHWLFQDSYVEMRVNSLTNLDWRFAAKLGTGAFETISGEIVNVALVTITRPAKPTNRSLFGIECDQESGILGKCIRLTGGELMFNTQDAILSNPDSRLSLDELSSAKLLEDYALAPQGIITGDLDRWQRLFWEIGAIGSPWRTFLSTSPVSGPYLGRQHLVDWRDEGASMIRPRPGNLALGKFGVAVSQMGDLPVSLYCGELYDGNVAPIVPINPKHVPLIWSLVNDISFRSELRKLDKNTKVTNGVLLKVPFDLAHWQKVAEEKYPHGLPKPHSSDPTQWLFNGHPRESDQPLQVAVARLLGYQWPRQTGSSFPDCPALGPDGLEPLADADGIVCLSALNREFPAADRLRKLLHAAWEPDAPPADRDLLAQAGAKATTLEDWLRDEFFEQHFEIFHHRPFIWHIWDGRKDGFHALVNYHRLDHAALQKLAFSYLGAWIHLQEDGEKSGVPGAELRLGAARGLQAKLTLILEGEAPDDLFVRWKPLRAQAIGWHPDLNDGVRLNIRPFAVADVLRKKVKIKWDKDRGKEPERPKADFPWFWCEEDPGTDPAGGKTFTGNRWNDVHLTLGLKQKAREEAKHT